MEVEIAAGLVAGRGRKRPACIARPRIAGLEEIILIGSAKPRSRRSAILPWMVSSAKPSTEGFDEIIFTGSAKPKSRNFSKLCRTF